ncbi:uncharacterized protein LOC130712931 [Lotus japonicus]|uniref:uncharacterized protein LOC130712931 n=1 Tax=Lotus japonicus TaxID=34305 RepID=UPI002588896D|nr:uncharacterized protein LOC130712931 [Lotus japonicus]
MSGPWLTWNVRGLGDTTKREAVKKAILQLRSELLFFQETKLNEQRQRTIEKWTQGLSMNHVEVFSEGAAGGLMCLWRESNLRVLSVVKDVSFIFLTLHVPNIDQTVLVGNVYGPHTLLERRLLFEALKVQVLSHVGMTFIGGDFNAVLLGSERSSGGVLDAGDAVFQQFVHECHLNDLPLLNGKFTWFSGRNDGLWSRLDRWLVSDDVLIFFNNISQTIFDWSVSDHRAVGLSFGVPDAGPKPFYYFNHWVEEDGFNDLVETWWRSAVYQGWSGYVLQQKLKGLRRKIREWRRGRGAWGVEKIVSLESRLQEVMGALENQGGSEALTKERRSVLEDLWRAYREEERVWRQKSRVRWLKDGDRNTKFFHRMCKVRTVKKNITQLRYQGRLLTSPTDIKEATRDHFQNFFRVADVPRPWFQNQNLQKVSDVNNQFLEAAFSLEEIWEVVKNFDGNRAPGPDGFSMDFF